MFDVHFAWIADGGLLIWGEDYHRYSRSLGRRRPRSTSACGEFPPHPYSLSRHRLRSLMQDVLCDRYHLLETVLACVRVPTYGRAPVIGRGYPASSDDGSSPALFEVDGYLLPASSMGMGLQLLGGSFEIEGTPTFGYLLALSQVVFGLCEKGAVTPDWVRRPDGRGIGVWRPDLSAAPERALVRELVASAPGVLWACEGVRPSRKRPWDEHLRGPPVPTMAVRRMLEYLVAAVAPALIRAELRPPRNRSAPGQWVRSLVDPRVVIQVSEGEVPDPGEVIHAWATRRADPVRGRLRPAVRLEEGEERWAAHFGVRGDQGDLSDELVEEWTREQREKFASFAPFLVGDEAEVSLSPREAHGLLMFGPDRLAELGWVLEVPAWWLRRRLARRATVTPAAAAEGSTLGLDALCRVDWSVVLDGEPLGGEELETLVASGEPLVRVGARWVAIDDRQRDALARILEDAPGEGEDDLAARSALVEAFRAAVGLDDAASGLPVEEVVGEGWLASLLGEGAAAPRAADVPRRFVGELRDYQRRGLAWLRHLEEHGLGACLADDMGLGKTVQVLALLAGERPARKRCTLLVAPLSVLGNWRREAARFVPDLRVHVYHGPGRGEAEDLRCAAREHDLLLTTYGVLAREREALAELEWHRVVLDEAQAIKNPRTRTARAARALRAARRLALTGTPVENHLLELWSIMHFLNPGLLGSQRDFRTRLARPIEADRDEARAEALRRLVGPFVLRRRKSDPGLLPELPEKIQSRRDCRLTKEQARLYRATTEEALAELDRADGMQRRGMVLALLTRLKKICNHPEHFAREGGELSGRSGKLDELDGLLEVLAESGERALCFTQYREMGELLRDHLAARFGEPPPFLHGGVSAQGRERLVDAFQQGEGPPVLLVSLRAGGTGLNLTAASHVVHYDRWWNPAVEDQATDRAHRIGQHRTVQVHKLVTLGTLEERIDEKIEAKRELAEAVVGGGEAWVTELSTAELRELLSLTDPDRGRASR